MSADPKCKICRRAGEKLFLKGEKCFTPKCVFVKKPYAPGKPDNERKHKSTRTEYGKALTEKQKVRNTYGLRERQFRNYVDTASQKEGANPGSILFELLESRLDNTVFRMGLALSRALARQMVSHGHITVNGRKVTIPSYRVRVGDVVSVREGSKASKLFENVGGRLEKMPVIHWMKLNGGALQGEIVSRPALEKEQVPFDLTSVIEFYSR